MIGSIILPDTKKEEWDILRQRILSRVLETFGTPPAEILSLKDDYEEIERYENYGLEHVRIRYHVLDDEWNEAIFVLPENLKHQKCAPAVITIHGTNGKIGKNGMLNPEVYPRRGYGIELAKRGFVTVSPDQFGFGESIRLTHPEELYREFFLKYPNWSLTGRRLLGHIRLLDILDRMDFIQKGGYGVMGNSLGGSAALYLTSMDPRIAAAVVSAGVSPKITNVYRNLNTGRLLNPAVSAAIERNGKIPWDMHEIIALCAPKAVMLIEPFNDPYNPYALPTLECVNSASEVYKLLEHPDRLSLYLHGDGHDTVDDVRSMAYNWLTRFLVSD